MVRRLKTALFVTAAISAAGTCTVVYVAGEETASAETLPHGEAAVRQVSERQIMELPSDEEMAARVERIRQEEGVRSVTTEEQAEAEAAVAAASKLRRVKRWVWESPAETRARMWNLPENESDEATATGLLRICLSEADGSRDDCVAIWQVLRNIRSRSCNRGMIRRITECDDSGETMLSAMRRAQRSVMGMAKARSTRTRWIREVGLDCAQPPSWPHSERLWQRQYGRSCGEASTLARRLVRGDDVELVIRGARPIAWGGRCESNRGACDDPIACSRGLARIEGLETHNAFWCRPNTPGCRTGVDPICREMGYGREEVSPEDVVEVVHLDSAPREVEPI